MRDDQRPSTLHAGDALLVAHRIPAALPRGAGTSPLTRSTGKPSARAQCYVWARVVVAAVASLFVGELGLAATAAPAALPAPLEPSLRSSLRYDTDYPTIDYGGVPVDNEIARLQARLDRGEVKLQFNPTRGYLDSLLQALDIDPSSQALVYSKSSLQIQAIRASTPRAIYFKDDTYVAWVQGGGALEIAAVDRTLGHVFYTLPNRLAANANTQFARETFRCLNCHDTFALSGGGVPRFLVNSAPVDLNGELLPQVTPSETTDETPLALRWGGWYVTGQHGKQTHLGNIQIKDRKAPLNLDSLRQGNVTELDGLFDVRPYLSNKSDIVALLVFEHQIQVQNLLVRANFKSRTLLAKEQQPGTPLPRTLDELSPKTQLSLKRMLEPIAQSMLFVRAAEITSPITGGSGFDAWFQARGPRDTAGRSLRELSLNGRLFRYPMSYVVYTAAFDGLPECATDYLYGRFADILTGRDQSAPYSRLSVADRKAVLEILTATKPEFAKVLAARGSAT